MADRMSPIPWARLDRAPALSELLRPLVDDFHQLCRIESQGASEWAPTKMDSKIMEMMAQGDQELAISLSTLRRQICPLPTNNSPFAPRYPHLLATMPSDWPQWAFRRYSFAVFNRVRSHALAKIHYAPLRELLHQLDTQETLFAGYLGDTLESMSLADSPVTLSLRRTILRDWPLLADLFEWGVDDMNWVLWAIADLAPHVLLSDWERHMHERLVSWDIPWPGSLPAPLPQARHPWQPRKGHRSFASTMSSSSSGIGGLRA